MLPIPQFAHTVKKYARWHQETNAYDGYVRAYVHTDETTVTSARNRACEVDACMAKGALVVSTRRCEEEIQHALYEAALAELLAQGYSGITMERIAARAQTAKGVLYRRWPDKRGLVLAALRRRLPPPPAARRDFSARQNLLAVLGSLADTLTGKNSFPGLSVIAQLLHDPELRTMYADWVVRPRIRLIHEIICDGISTGEIDPTTVTHLKPETGTALVIHCVQLTGNPPTKRELQHIVDTLISHPANRHRDKPVHGSR